LTRPQKSQKPDENLKPFKECDGKIRTIGIKAMIFKGKGLFIGRAADKKERSKTGPFIGKCEV